MFQVRITQKALRKVAEHTHKPYEQIGLLIGGMEDGRLIINDIVKGEGDHNGTSTIFSTPSLARVAHAMVSGKLKGGIVGWYHSHIGYGIFMSEQDVQTQMTLQQFSPYVVALIIDPQINEFGLFTIMENGVQQIPMEYIVISR